MSKRRDQEARDKLRAAREAANLSQAELAEKLGCSRAAVCRWESEDPAKRRKPDLPAALKLKEVLRINPTVWV
jgi:DNA-binding XRE family transcriptional regulator